MDEAGLLQNLINEEGFILDVQGQPSIMNIQGRAVTVTGSLGYLFSSKARE